MSKSNAWSDPSKTDPVEVSQMAAFLEERSRTPDAQAVNAALCNILDPQPGQRILEVGCGSGVLCRLIAPQLQPAGEMLGLDISPHFVEQASKYALQSGVASLIKFETGPAESLTYPNDSFNSALAARLLLHAKDPDAVVREMARVVKPGGRIIVMDWDFDTVVVDHPNRDLTRRLLTWRSDHHGGDNWSGRQLWRRMTTAGLQRLTIHPLVTVAHGEADGLTQSLWRAAQVSRDGGAISPEEHDDWVLDIKDRIQAGTFFASIVYFIVKGFVP
jgi:ubiquinone/menaquinone biosynthesis C-methylase UbiE